MLSKRRQRNHTLLKTSKFSDQSKQSTSGTLSPDTIATTSSGYSTGDSSISTSKKSSSSSITCNQHKTKSKGFHNLINKIKNFIISPKTKFVNSITSKEMPSSNIFDQYSTSYDLPLSTITTNNTISIPFTYYHHHSPIKSKYYNQQNHVSCITKTTNFEKISAWLDHTEMMTYDKQYFDELLFIDEIQEQSISPSPIEIDYQSKITFLFLSSLESRQDKQLNKLIMKKTSSTVKTPKRSTSLVSTLNRPVIEQKQYERAVSPTASFTSSILTKGMFERMTPQRTSHQSHTNLPDEQTTNLLTKSNRRRVIDFSRRRTVATSTEQNNNNNNNNDKENIPINRRQQIYRFSPSTSNNITTKKYYFHPKPSVKNEDMLMNSYGLTLLQQQQPIQQRQSLSSTMITSKIPDNSLINLLHKQQNHRSSIHLPQQQYTSDSLDDLLCDREVESYFYPQRRQSPTSIPQHIYVNLDTPSNYYPPPPPYIHGTLC
ncbi:unnamed protein product [Rotaria sordida]|uniref:Uncharacterized protein n=1 Tax=Rotaria sordida TaxID=392033 RepID=A0A814GIX2_9BILA|nr:unnamed protein product [Rotaria sordida]